MNERDLSRIIENLSWPDNYYERLSGAERRRLLDEAILMNDTEENRMRLKIWECRYGKVPKGKSETGMDRFIKLWMDLDYASHRLGAVFGLRFIVKPIRQDMDILGITRLQDFGAYGEELMYQEMVQMGRYYFALCEEDKSYTSLALGLSRLNHEQFLQKITEDVYRICYQTPKVFGLQKELKLFTRAVTEALEIDFPGQKIKLMDAVQTNLGIL